METARPLGEFLLVSIALLLSACAPVERQAKERTPIRASSDRYGENSLRCKTQRRVWLCGFRSRSPEAMTSGARRPGCDYVVVQLEATLPPPAIGAETPRLDLAAATSRGTEFRHFRLIFRGRILVGWRTATALQEGDAPQARFAFAARTPIVRTIVVLATLALAALALASVVLATLVLATLVLATLALSLALAAHRLAPGWILTTILLPTVMLAVVRGIGAIGTAAIGARVGTSLGTIGLRLIGLTVLIRILRLAVLATVAPTLVAARHETALALDDAVSSGPRAAR